MEIKEKIEQMAKKVLSDKALMELFEKDPIKAVEKVLGVDLPDELVGTRYYEYGPNKTEQAAKQYWDIVKGEK